MGLSNYQLVLLDNLIYLDTVVGEEAVTIGDVVNRLLYKDGNPANDFGTGTITTDWNNHYKPDDPKAKNCMTDIDEWKQILKAIEDDKTLCSMKFPPRFGRLSYARYNIHSRDVCTQLQA